MGAGLGIDFTGLINAGTKVADSAASIELARRNAQIAKANATSAAEVARANADAKNAEARIAAGRPVVTSKYATPIKIGLGVVGVGLAFLLFKMVSKRRARR